MSRIGHLQPRARVGTAHAWCTIYRPRRETPGFRGAPPQDQAWNAQHALMEDGSMKRILMGTTALVAAGAFAGIGATQAQDMMVPMKAGVGGYYTIAAISTDTDGDDDRPRPRDRSKHRDCSSRATLPSTTASPPASGSGSTATTVTACTITVSRQRSRRRPRASTGPARKSTTARRIRSPSRTPAQKASSAVETTTTSPRPRCTSRVPSARSTPAMIEGAAQQMALWAPGGSVPIGGVKSAWFGN